MGYAYYRLHFEIPKEIRGLFNELAKEYGFEHGGTIHSQIMQVESQEVSVRNDFQSVSGSRLFAKILEKKKEIDLAMPVKDNSQLSNTGGIDLTSKRYKISIQGDGQDLKMDLDAPAMKDFNFDGIEFHIDRIQSVPNPQLYLSTA